MGAKAPAEASKKDGAKKKDEDEDPNGLELLKKPALEECLKYVNLLIKFLPDKLETHLLAYDVYKQMERPLACAKALRAAAVIDATAPDLHPRMCEFFHRCESGALKLTEVQKMVLDELKADTEMLAGKPVQAFNAAFMAASTGNAKARTAGAMGMLAMEAPKASVVPLLTDLSGEGVTLAGCVEVYETVKGLDEGAAEAYKKTCAERFPLSTFFNPAVLNDELVFSPEKQYRDKEVEG